MGVDARVVYTKTGVRGAFVELLRTRPLAQIRVREICAIAGISRATFYRHYDGVEGLLDAIEDEFIEQIEGALREASEENIHDTLVLILAAFEENADVFSELSSRNADPLFPYKIFEACFRNYREASARNMGVSLRPEEGQWLYGYTCWGFYGVVMRWMAGGMKEPVSAVAEFAERLLMGSVEGLKEKGRHDDAAAFEPAGEGR